MLNCNVKLEAPLELQANEVLYRQICTVQKYERADITE